MPANWEWVDDKDNWTPYDHKDNMVIENAYKSGVESYATKDLSFNVEYGSLYVYNFKKMTQTNSDSGRVRKLRRIETGESEEALGYLSMLKEGSVKMMAFPAAAVAEAPPPVVEDATIPDEEPPPKKWKFELPPLAGAAAEPTASSAPAAAVASPPVALSKAEDDAAKALVFVDPKLAAEQAALGAQSRRKQPYDLGPVAADPHGKYCFDRMLSREKQLAGEWAVFYHSYSYAALLYEVQAAVAAVLFRFKSEFATLPRLLKAPFNDIPDAPTLMKEFPKMKSRDHDPRFRAVGLSGTSSLLASDSEAPPKGVFLHGYSCCDVSFFGVLENLLVSCGVPKKDKTKLAQEIVDLSAKHGLDVSQFKGKACKSGRAGHMLQIFVRRSLVDRYVYPALPFGVVDKKRPVLSKYLEGPGPIAGQVRIVANPSVFMRGNAVRMYVCSADPTFHGNRPKFQQEMTEILGPVIGKAEVRIAAAKGIYGGTLPTWFNAEDYEAQKKKTAPGAGET